MVIEDLIPIRVAEKNPIDMLPIAFLYSTMAIFLAAWIFPSNAAIVAVFLATLACMPLMLSLIGFEKEKEEMHRDYLKRVVYSLFGGAKSHGASEPAEQLLPFFIWLFLGLAVAFTFWFAVLPKDFAANLFYVQLNTIKEINLGFSGNSAAIGLFFSKILLNNIKVLAFAVLFSIIYGAGAIFILVWNASVIGVAIGDTMRNALSAYAPAIGFVSIAGYSTAIGSSLMRYMLHGIPEILAYFIGALAGGMISIAVVRHEWNSEKFEATTYNALGLVIMAILILVIAAMLEVTVSPLILVK